MKLFVNDTPVIFASVQNLSDTSYDYTFNALANNIVEAKLKEDVLVHYANPTYIKNALDYFSKKKVKNLDSITFAVADLEETVAMVKDQFKIVQAGGGVVRKEDRVLLIFRLSKWDLPKGKLEKGESPTEGALREVEEECSVKVELKNEVCQTWHTYTRNKKKYLKQTYWFAMDCLDDSQLQPQTEEDIEEVRWMNTSEVHQALYDSYFSIRYVMRQYYQQLENQSS
ncbi:NUDIX hydrolase [Tunicatimonas pelagia]|uniref:NUDIX hydrolase n=1 Tax=Tunicatimonas pelagia TaxID=931531 RepID=UPI002665DB76|nr:NUDIX hydrolase [Tunicatimonas pelagia]WKN45922.1 NUDIX hydrolase [Tunicatimonas pelagia]